jgi:phage shock protein E
MKYLVLPLVFAAGFATAHLTGLTTAADPKPPEPPKAAPPANPNIDMNAFLTGAQAAAKHRESRRLSEEDFLKMSQEEGVIVLDARSKQMYDLLHVKGAINLNFSDIDVESIKKVLPDKNAKILIYCNNNFTPAPDAKNPARQEVTPNGGVPVANKNAELAKLAMRPKSAGLSLNLSTQMVLFNYGYKNVYELAPTVDPDKTKLTLVSNKK